MKITVIFCALVASLFFISSEAIAQNKAVAPASADVIEVNDNSKANVNDETKTAAQPNANTVDVSNGLTGRNTVVERSPEMLERKKIAPLVNDPQ